MTKTPRVLSAATASDGIRPKVKLNTLAPLSSATGKVFSNGSAMVSGRTGSGAPTSAPARRTAATVVSAPSGRGGTCCGANRLTPKDRLVWPLTFSTAPRKASGVR